MQVTPIIHLPGPRVLAVLSLNLRHEGGTSGESAATTTGQLVTHTTKNVAVHTER
jgi:hypothetical protein